MPLNITMRRTYAGAKSALHTSLYVARLFPEDLNLVAVIPPLVKTEPAQQRLTQTKPPHIMLCQCNDIRKFLVRLCD
jgi:short-subunit dehydrogenase involved in D-alanine esterification of teichoic acids